MKDICQKFLNDVVVEAKKITFPARRDTMMMLVTIVAITSVVSIVIAFVDYMASITINALFKL